MVHALHGQDHDQGINKVVYKQLKYASYGWPGSSLRDKKRSSIRVESLLLHFRRSQLRWFRRLIRMPPGILPLKILQAHFTEKKAPEHSGDCSVFLLWHGKALRSHRRSWGVMLGKGMSESLSLTCCLCKSAMDGWMVGCSDNWEQTSLITLLKQHAQRCVQTAQPKRNPHILCFFSPPPVLHNILPLQSF